MRLLYRLLLTVVFVGVTALLSGCAGSGRGYSVYGGYGYPHYRHDIGYNSTYYYNDDDDLINRRGRVEQRRRDRVNRIENMNPDQRRQVSRRLQQTSPQRAQRRQVRQVNRSNMGRPRARARRR